MKSLDSIAWLSQLISFDTTSRHSNLELIHCVRDFLTQHQLTTNLSYNADKTKANLFATIPAQDGAIQGGLMLSGHTDVVPVDNQEWHSNPFQANQIDNKIYGRGACDMKGFLAVLLAMTPEFTQMNLQKPLHFAFSYDEEVGCWGARLLLEDIKQSGRKPAACIVGEPTMMMPVSGHKGANIVHARVHGQEMHSSLTPKGCNAIDYAADLISWIRHLAKHYQQEGPFDPYYDVPFTTISTNIIKGGTAGNIIPALCEFTFDFRNLPITQRQEVILKINHYIEKELLPKMQQDHVNGRIELVDACGVPGLETAEHEALTQLVREITEEQTIRKVAYATEAGLFQQAGIPTLVCGPGNIEQAHRPDEFVTIEQLTLCEQFLRKLVCRYHAIPLTL